MSLDHDLELILGVVERTDPSFRSVERERIERRTKDLQTNLAECRREEFLLSAMSLFALAGNGHTRLIPNDAISVLPFRFVSVGEAIFLTKTLGEFAEFAPGRLHRVNGTPVEGFLQTADCYLAGTRQRKRVIGPIMLAWPAALVRLGVAAENGEISYQIVDAKGQIRTVRANCNRTVPACSLYPNSEHGRIDPSLSFRDYVEIQEWSDIGRSIILPSFFDKEGSALRDAIASAENRVRLCPTLPLLIDVRGNTGGDFLSVMPLVEAITECGQESGCVVLVDKFTFSAAIVFVAILKHRLGDKLKLVGEDMGDGLRFFAEGGLIDLPACGAVMRYSTALHDWETGTIDQTTPPEIAEHIVPVKDLKIDHHWVESPFDEISREGVHRRFLKELGFSL
ncbi:hypothetical protein SAMN05444358_101240 [Ruegeria halocynthiae]|uniref:Peptidase family S41 n=1 Tax=Ruegeria halocynthiae TaxID=985054 RepID=A0A1H2RQU3_9RHOB|nr:peptidase S41 [Ruegeria halocynthiae]SDW21697.1 hypothetical protein SAMN05444358_101240 [Ruegeria halocynthiae]